MTNKILIDRAVAERVLEAMDDMASDSRVLDMNPTRIHIFDTARDALRAALEQPQVEQEPAPNGATHRQPKQGAFYKRVDGKWYVWSRMENGEPHRWYISPGTAESCLEPIYTHPQPPHQPLTEMQIVELRQLTPGTLDVQFVKFARVIEAAHGIKEQK